MRGDVVIQVTDEGNSSILVTPPGNVLHVARGETETRQVSFVYLERPARRRRQVKSLARALGCAQKRLRRNGVIRELVVRAGSAEHVGGDPMSTTDTSEKGLETLIMRHMTGTDGLAVAPGAVAEKPDAYAAPATSPAARRTTTAPTRSMCRSSSPSCAPPSPSVQEAGDGRCNDPRTSTASSFSPASRPRSASAASSMCCARAWSTGRCTSISSMARRRRATPRPRLCTPQNRFSITRQLAYSMDETRRALDLCLFINGLPIATFELKNSLTKQTVEDAVEQYRRDRDPRERLFEFGRCVVHFAVDDSEVQMCTELQGQGLVVPAVQQGLQRRRGQPAQPARPQDRLPLEEVLTPAGLTNILENYAQIVEEKDPRPARRSASRCGRATTSSAWCGRRWPMCAPTARASAT